MGSQLVVGLVLHWTFYFYDGVHESCEMRPTETAAKLAKCKTLCLPQNTEPNHPNERLCCFHCLMVKLDQRVNVKVGYALTLWNGSFLILLPACVFPGIYSKTFSQNLLELKMISSAPDQGVSLPQSKLTPWPHEKNGLLWEKSKENKTQWSFFCCWYSIIHPGQLL